VGVYSAGRRLWNVLGTSRHLMTICTIAGGFGTGYTLGDNRVGMDPETLRLSKLIVLWGANVLSTNPHLWRSISEARANGATLVAIDPIRTRTAAQSDWHLAPLPGTDAALALGLLHVVLAEGKEDGAFIEGHTLGWPAFRQRILEFPPARVAAITGLPTESIALLGRQLAATRPTGIRIGIGIQRAAAAWPSGRSRASSASPVTGVIRAAASVTTRGLLRTELARPVARRPADPPGPRAPDARLGEAC
jgi:anaerobic selenocysteine-containing dehydrogenase